MTLSVVKPIKPEVRQDVVEMCEGLLERAKAGKIKSLVACYENSDRTITTSMEVHGNLFAMSHAISALWFRFQTRMAEDNTLDHGRGEES